MYSQEMKQKKNAKCYCDFITQLRNLEAALAKVQTEGCL
jgi:hypothetical protein